MDNFKKILTYALLGVNAMCMFFFYQASSTSIKHKNTQEEISYTIDVLVLQNSIFQSLLILFGFMLTALSVLGYSIIKNIIEDQVKKNIGTALSKEIQIREHNGDMSAQLIAKQPKPSATKEVE